MPDKSRIPVIVGAARTPIGKFLGALSPLSAPELGAIAIREALKRSRVPAEDVQEVIMGHVIQGGTGQAPARQAALKAGLPATVSAVTVNKVCGSGLKAVMLASQAIKAGDAQVIIAGGQESMSNAPYYVYGMRNGVKLSDQKMVDGMIKDGLWCASCDVHMGSHAEYTARKAAVTREEQDEFAAASHRKAVSAIEAGKFRNEIAPVQVPGKKGPTTVDTDEGPRKGHDSRDSREASPRIPRQERQQRRAERHRRQLFEPERWCRCARRRLRGVCEHAQPGDTRTHHRLRDWSDQSGRSVLRPDQSCAEPDEEDRSATERLRSD